MSQLFLVKDNGSIQLDVNNNILTLHASQVLICHTNMMLKMVKCSKNFDCQILALTDSILKTVLNSECDIWNKAMYLHNLYVFDMTVPGNVDNNYIEGILSQSGAPLQKEILHSLLRTYMLSVCRLFVSSGQLDESEHEGIYNPKNYYFNKFLQNLASKRVKKQSVKVYANELCISPKYLSVICTSLSGKSPSKWITEYIVEDIKSCLKNTELSIKEICHSLGFCNDAFFGKFTKKQTGFSPMQLRRHLQQPNLSDH